MNDTEECEFIALIQRESRYTYEFHDDALQLSTGGCNPKVFRKESPSTVILHDDNEAESIYVQEVMRSKMCQWMYRVVDYCDFDRKVTFIA